MFVLMSTRLLAFITLFLFRIALAVSNTALELSPVTKYGSTSALESSLTELFSPISALVTIDTSAGVVNILATTPSPSNSFFTPSVLSDVAASATSAGFEGGFGPAILGTSCGFSSAVPYVAAPNETSPGLLDCSDSLTVTLTTEGNPPPEAITSAFCKTLNLESCMSISTSVTGEKATVSVRTKDPINALTIIKAALLTPSYLTMLRASDASVFSTLIFVRQSIEIEQRDGSMSLCADKLWYLTFLILLGPIMYVASRLLYQCGAARGRKKAELENKRNKESDATHLKLLALQQLQQKEYEQMLAAQVMRR